MRRDIPKILTYALKNFMPGTGGMGFCSCCGTIGTHHERPSTRSNYICNTPQADEASVQSVKDRLPGAKFFTIKDKEVGVPITLLSWVDRDTLEALELV